MQVELGLTLKQKKNLLQMKISKIFDFFGTFPPKIPLLKDVNNLPKSFCMITKDGTIRRTKNIPNPSPKDKVIIVGFKKLRSC